MYKKLILAASILLLFCTGGILTYQYLKEGKPAAVNKKEVDSSPEPMKAPIEKSTALKKTVPSYEVYDILGSSHKLTEKQVKAMSEWRAAVKELTLCHREELYINGPTDKKLVALTFDDGPDPVITPAIVKVLDKYQVKGSFFFMGEEIPSNKKAVAAVHDSGHLILNHSYSHKELTKLSADKLLVEIEHTNELIRELTGCTPAIIRPPYGTLDEKTLEELSKAGMTSVLWSLDSLDWSLRDRNYIVKNVLDNVRPGEIILMHSNGDKSETLAALPTIIEGLRQRGYDMVDLSTLLGIKAYK